MLFRSVEDITYAYGTNVGNGDGGFLTVGAENNIGSRGQNVYFNGAGTPPANGTQLRVVNTPCVPCDSFLATLTGAQETPPNASPATGAGTVVLDSTGTMISVNLTFSGLSAAATAAHIHVGAPGVAGSVIIPLTGFPAATSGTYSNTFAITPAQVSQLRSGLLYLNIHTSTFPGGEIRGQLTSPACRVPCNENFDNVTAPALPAGWTTTHTGVEVNWVTSTTTPDTPLNDAFAPDPNAIGNTELVSPNFVVAAGGSTMSFRRSNNMETGFDGAVLEISINGAPYQDIIAAGGSFSAGAYNGTISVNFGSPIAGRMAWTGNSGGYVTTTVQLPAAANGQIVRMKWRAASDSSVSGVGIFIDTITGISCTATAAGVTVSGRVLTPDGRGLRNARVVITDSQGNARTVTTSSFGFYRFDDVTVGESYVIGVVSKLYRFQSRLVSVTDTLTDVDFVGLE